MSRVATLEREKQTKATEAAALVRSTMQRCDAENREMTDEERAPITKASAEIKDLEARIERLKGDETVAAQLETLASGLSSRAAAQASGLFPVRGAGQPQLSMGQQFVHAEGYEFFRQKGHRTSSAWRSPTIELQAATLTSDPASGGSLIVPQYLPGIIPLPQRPLVVADLFAPGTTTSNAITYMVEKTFTNAAAAVAEGAAKPESALVFQALTEAVRKVAHWLPVTEEMLEDVAQISSYIDARLRLGVQLAEDDQLLNGDGVAPNLLGILHRVGLAAPIARVDPDNNADVLLKQAMAIFHTSYLMPDGFVLNPINWTATILMKNLQGQYLVAGPFAPIQSPTLWGLPVAVTPVMAAGVGLVGAFKSAAQIFRHGGIRVEASNSHQDFFVKNLVAIRAEERLAEAVYRPGAFGTVTALQ
jgi:HK97 family phage major capsid protein